MRFLLVFAISFDAFAGPWVCRPNHEVEGFPRSIELTAEEYENDVSSKRAIEGQEYVLTPKENAVMLSIQKPALAYSCNSSPGSDRGRYPEMYECETDKKDSAYPADFMVNERTVSTQNKNRPYTIPGSQETQKYMVSGEGEKVSLSALVGNVDFKCVKQAERGIASE